MSLIKGKTEFRTILDVNSKASKNQINKALRQVEVIELVCNEDANHYTFVENDIVVGMYNIRLEFYSISTEQRSRLKEYGGFKVSIYENNNSTGIKLNRDKRFKNQYWVKLNQDYKIRTNILTDIIMYTKRLDELKLFL